jgi:hypothetical protein
MSIVPSRSRNGLRDAVGAAERAAFVAGLLQVAVVLAAPWLGGCQTCRATYGQRRVWLSVERPHARAVRIYACSSREALDCDLGTSEALEGVRTDIASGDDGDEVTIDIPVVGSLFTPCEYAKRVLIVEADGCERAVVEIDDVLERPPPDVRAQVKLSCESKTQAGGPK